MNSSKTSKSTCRWRRKPVWPVWKLKFRFWEDWRKRKWRKRRSDLTSRWASSSRSLHNLYKKLNRSLHNLYSTGLCITFIKQVYLPYLEQVIHCITFINNWTGRYITFIYHRKGHCITFINNWTGHCITFIQQVFAYPSLSRSLHNLYFPYLEQVIHCISFIYHWKGHWCKPYLP